MSDRVFPNLFVVGAMKAGTSSLHEYLHQHPQIFMSRFKEPQYFAPHLTRWKQAWGQGNPYPEPGIEWYLRLFEEAGEARYAGESSVSYAARPWVVDCEKRIFEFNPESRIIYLVRDPLERALSHYWHFAREGREDLDLLAAVRRREDYIARSDYAMQLRPYLSVFPRSQIHVLTLEELNRRPQAAFRRLFEWLGVDSEVKVDIDQRHNVGDSEFRQTRRGMVFIDTVLKHWRWRQVERWLPGTSRRAVERLTYRHVRRDAANIEEAANYLRPILQPKAYEFFDLLGCECREWKSLFPEFSARALTPMSVSSG